MVRAGRLARDEPDVNAFALCAVAMTLPMLLTMWVPETILFYATAPAAPPCSFRHEALLKIRLV